MPTALLSVSDKSGLLPFATALAARGWTLLSTGGTARTLREAGVAVTEVSEVTGHPEILDGRVKTLHPAIHAGLLARRGHGADEAQMGAHEYGFIDLVAVNLYPFRETVARVGVRDDEVIEQIDIGGPAMLRSAAKNHDAVWVVVDPADYELVIRALDSEPEKTRSVRRTLARKVYAHTSAYDAAIADYLDGHPDDGPFSRTLTLDLSLRRNLRYGENPAQTAAFYARRGDEGGFAGLRQLHGKELSYNNILDLDGALLAISAWSDGTDAACAIIKHTTPCGVAIASTAEEAYRRALSTDSSSAFGSVLAFNCEVGDACAELIRPNFVEAIVAPSFSERALALLKEKKNLRLITVPPETSGFELDVKGVRGGFLVQSRLRLPPSEESWRVVTERTPTAGELLDCRFAWRAIAAVKSNAIVLARGGMTVGIGAGQMSRVDSSRIAVWKARENGFDLQGSVLASDAYFPFRDGVDAAAEAGVKAIVQPGGSIRDEEVVRAANEHGMAMVFTGERLFRH